MDMQGRTVDEHTVATERTVIDVSQLGAGLFILEMMTDGELIGRGRFIRN
jgi:hypothetical protein